MSSLAALLLTSTWVLAIVLLALPPVALLGVVVLVPIGWLIDDYLGWPAGMQGSPPRGDQR